MFSNLITISKQVRQKQIQGYYREKAERIVSLHRENYIFKKLLKINPKLGIKWEFGNVWLGASVNFF